MSAQSKDNPHNYDLSFAPLLSFASSALFFLTATLLFIRDGPYIAQLLGGNYFTHATRNRITTNLKHEVRDDVYTFMYPEEYTSTATQVAKRHCQEIG